jgi:hypothetical protein
VRALLGEGVFNFQYTGVSDVGKLIRVKAVCQQREKTQQATVRGEKKKTHRGFKIYIGHLTLSREHF